MAFLPALIFLFLCVLYFVVFKAFDMTALAMGIRLTVDRCNFCSRLLKVLGTCAARY